MAKVKEIGRILSDLHTLLGIKADPHELDLQAPEDMANIAKFLDGIMSRLTTLDQLILNFSQGAFNQKILSDGAIFTHLATFQQTLQHFVQQMESVSQGDLEVKTDEFGTISEIFNSLTENLRLATDQLANQNLVLERLATIDPLTGLFNRGHLLLRLREELARANRYQSPLSAILLDLDDFKNINDSYGHQVGDEVLKCVGSVIRHQGRMSDVAGRYGGEEFLIVATETSAEKTMILAERIREEIENFIFSSDEIRFQITVSQGISGKTAFDEMIDDELIRQADLALYRAKKLGKNRVVLFSECCEPEIP